MSNADIATRVAFFSEFSGEEFIELGTEDTVSYELALFADLRGHFEGIYRARLESASSHWNVHPSPAASYSASKLNQRTHAGILYPSCQ